ncbi:MAG: hypothetical protein AB7F89_17945 [Pirellulaceae bacterium]
MTVTRLLARQIRSVFRRALSISVRDADVLIRFATGPAGLIVRAQAGDRAVEYIDPAPQSAGEAACTLRDLSECEGRKPELLILDSNGTQQIIARWSDQGIPQLHQRSLPTGTSATDFPDDPGNGVENPPELLAALSAAAKTCDETSSRYVLQTVQLQGVKGALVATDGKQLLRQEGFRFPFDDDVLVYPSAVFECQELSRDRPVLVNRLAKHVVVEIKPWTIWLPIEVERRFPRVDDIIPSPRDASSTFELAPSDRDFLGSMLARLPAQSEPNHPVTIDLNGAIAVRAKASDHTQGTELILSQSRYDGEQIRLCMNRSFLQRAIELGFHRVHFYGKSNPAMASDEHRQLIWALLDSDFSVKPAENHIRLESPKASQPAVRRSCHRRGHENIAATLRSTSELSVDRNQNRSEIDEVPKRPGDSAHRRRIRPMEVIRSAQNQAVQAPT